MFQNTPYTSPEWPLAIYIPPISLTRLPFLPGLSCTSGFYTFLDGLWTDGKWDLFVVLICLSGLLGWPKRAYAFFPEYIQEKTHTPFLAKCIIVDVLPLFMCSKGDSYLPPEIWGLVPAHSSLIYNLGTLPPGRLCCPSNKGWERNNVAALWLFLTTAALNPVLMVA